MTVLWSEEVITSLLSGLESQLSLMTCCVINFPIISTCERPDPWANLASLFSSLETKKALTLFIPVVLTKQWNCSEAEQALSAQSANPCVKSELGTVSTGDGRMGQRTWLHSQIPS